MKALVSLASLIAIAIALTAPAALAAGETSPSPEAGGIDRAYQLVREGKGSEAIPIFEKHLEAHPDDFAARFDFAHLLDDQDLRKRAVEQMEVARDLKPDDPRPHLQLGYWYLDAKRDNDALQEFSLASQLDPEDNRPRIQRAYLLDARGDGYAAYREFYAVSRCDDPELAAAGQAALKRTSFFSGPPQREPWFGEIYVEHRIARRFNTQAGGLIVREGRKLGRNSPWEAYLIARYSWLRQKTTGAFPAYVADDSTMVGIGLRTRPVKSLPGLTTYAEVAHVVDLPNLATNRDRTDLRAGFYYSGSWDPQARGDNYYGRGRVHDLYAEGAYYNRFGHNWIGTIRYRDGVRLKGSKRSAFDIYAGALVGADSRGDFYNNIGELGIGLRYIPPWRGGWRITLEHVWGWYLGNDRRTPNPFSSKYDDLRGTISTFSYF